MSCREDEKHLLSPIHGLWQETVELSNHQNGILDGFQSTEIV